MTPLENKDSPSPQEWVTGSNLWRVGFRRDSLFLINHLSGLVEILLTIYDPRQDAVVFVIRSLDKSGILFREGILKADKITRYREIGQAIEVAVEASNPQLS